LDIIAHGLSTAAGAVAARRWAQRPIRTGWALFFGVCPDLVAFTIPACLRIWWWLTGASPSLLPQANGPHFEWVWGVYNGGHSLLVFGLFFAALSLVMRRPVLETLGWLLHILLDVFTHRGMFATQFLWPASAVHIDGIRWETPWLFGGTYAALLGIWLLLRRSRRSQPVEAGLQPAVGRRATTRRL
jgi:hypothetical protein